MREQLEIFICYAHEDEALRQALEKQLRALRRQGLIEIWHDRDISAGSDWAREIDNHLNTADIILLLVSPDFMDSDYCYGIEMQRALERHDRGEAYVIPIILRHVYWQTADFGKLQALPTDGKPIIDRSWHSQDEAFYIVTEGIRRVVQERLYHSRSIPGFQDRGSVSEQHPSQIYQLYEVFVKSGVPNVTFVEREDFGSLKLALAQPGRGVVIEGPSGVGKTTSLKKAIEELLPNPQSSRKTSKISMPVQMLSARNPEHRNKLQNLPNWHDGIVIIDDFHRLGLSLCTEMVDYLKHLADTEPESKKLVIVGIPQSGQTLVDMSFDVATRIDVFKWGKVKDELILQMITQGEKALNIDFDRKTEIVLAASGSLNIAQFLCFNICQREQIITTQDQLQVIRCNIGAAILSVMTDLSRKFGESIRRFAAMGGSRDITCVRLLEELARSDEGFLSLPVLQHRNPDLAHGIAQFVSEKWMDKLCSDYPICMNHLFFDQTIHALVVDDPQLTFFLSKTQISSLAKDVGKVISPTRQTVFISYSHKDAKWLERLLVHLKPLEREGKVNIWEDTQIDPGSKWREEIKTAIELATVAIVLVSADFLASKFISEHELPKLLSRAESEGTIILPLIVSHCLFTSSELIQFQAINSPDKPLIGMTPSEREQILVKLAETVNKRIAVGDI